jgi:hypothetical protein
MKAAADFILGLSLAVVATPNPAREKRISFFILIPHILITARPCWFSHWA